MFYEPYKPKKKKRRGCFARLLRTTVWVAVVCVGVWLFTSGALGDLLSSMGLSHVLPGSWTHVLLLGRDQTDEGVARTDSIMIASISSTGQVKLTSVMRDMLVSIPGKGQQKINAAYAFGGAELAMKTVSEAMGVNISRYVLIDFAGFADVIDAIGGVTVNVTKQEMNAMNRKKGHKLKAPGDVVLDGIQALRYSRIRKLDSDYMRAGRQREVLMSLLKRARSEKNPLTLWSMGTTALSKMETNMGIVQLGWMGTSVVLNGGELRQFRVPVDGTFDSGMRNGTWSIRANMEKNRALWNTFIYSY